MKTNSPIIIVGAGPVGLTLAIIFAKNNVAFKIIDKHETSSPQDRAITISSRTLEHFHLLGIAEKLIKEGVPCSILNYYYKKHRIAKTDFSKLQSRYNFLLQIAQPTIVQILTEELNHYGIQVERPVEFLRYKRNAHSICCYLEEQLTKEINEIKTKFLIACDGGTSTVRSQSGMEFKGQVENETIIQADIELKNFPLAYNERHYFILPNYFGFGVLPVQKINNKKISRIILTSKGKIPYKNDNEVLEALKNTIKKMGFKNIGYSNPIWVTNFNPKQFVAEKLYDDHIVYLGDAAHIQNPIGAQGLNTGIQDAFNFAWKYLFVTQHHFKEKLLETYHNERHLIAVNLLKFNEKNAKQIYSLNLFMRLLLFYKKKLNRFDYFNQKEIKAASQLGLFYPKNMESNQIRHPFFIPGHRFPDLLFKNNSVKSAYDLIKINKLLFVIFDNGKAIDQFLNYIEQFKTYSTFLVITKKPYVAGRSDNLNYIHDEDNLIYDAYQVKEQLLLLVRPDTYLELVLNSDNLGLFLKSSSILSI